MSNCQLPAFTQGERVRNAQENTLQFKRFFFQVVPSQPLHLPQRCAGGGLATSSMKLRHREAALSRRLGRFPGAGTRTVGGGPAPPR